MDYPSRISVALAMRFGPKHAESVSSGVVCWLAAYHRRASVKVYHPKPMHGSMAMLSDQHALPAFPALTDTKGAGPSASCGAIDTPLPVVG